MVCKSNNVEVISLFIERRTIMYQGTFLFSDIEIMKYLTLIRAAIIQPTTCPFPCLIFLNVGSYMSGFQLYWSYCKHYLNFDTCNYLTIQKYQINRLHSHLFNRHRLNFNSVRYCQDRWSRLSRTWLNLSKPIQRRYTTRNTSAAIC